MSAYRESFAIAGVGCWCEGSHSLYHYKLAGHTEECSQARIAWRANFAHLSEIDKQRRQDAEIGRQIREAAAAVSEASS